MAIRFSTDEIRAFSRACSKVDRPAKAHLRSGVLKAGEMVAQDAKRKASFSKKIPDSIEVKVLGNGTAVVAAGGDKAPNGAPLENKGRPGEFRHPVFGHKDRRWARQKAHPFLYPALLENADAAADLIADSVMDGVMEAIL